MRQTDSDVAMKRNNSHRPDSRHVAYRRHRKETDVHVRLHFLHSTIQDYALYHILNMIS